jgi:HK97 family phage major capsid protein
MAIPAATVQGDFSGFLTREQAQPIFERVARISVAQRLAQETPLGGRGVTIPVVTGKLTAGWVAEGAEKPKSKGTLGLKNMDPKKISVIAVVSSEVVRANPGNYMNVIRNQVAEAFAIGFDRAAFHNLGPDGTGTGPFSTNIDSTTKAVELGTASQATGGIYKDLVNGLSLLVLDGKRLTGFALDSVVEPLLLGSVDTTGRPIFIDSPLDQTTAALFDASAVQPAQPGRLIGRPSWMNEGVATPNLTSVVGYGGDFRQAAWGVVGGISYSVSTEATVTINGVLTSLWENNLVAVMAEAEYGWVVNDTAAFTKFTNAT